VRCRNQATLEASSEPEAAESRASAVNQFTLEQARRPTRTAQAKRHVSKLFILRY